MCVCVGGIYMMFHQSKYSSFDGKVSPDRVISGGADYERCDKCSVTSRASVRPSYGNRLIIIKDSFNDQKQKS